MDRRHLLVTVAISALGLSAIAAGNDGAAEDTRIVPASDPAFRYDGRFDFAAPASPVAIWEASTISVDFDGSRVAVRFGRPTGQVFFNASVDGVTAKLALREGMAAAPTILPVSGSGLHHLVLFKRTEASAGTVPFNGIQVEQGAKVFAPPTPAYAMKMEFLSDSMTAGACVEDGEKDQWEDRSTHNAAYSWAAVTAAAFSADYQNISISGIGVATGYVDVLAGQVWDRTYPSLSSPKADPSSWVPDVMFVLLGDNDDSYPRSNKLPFPGNFVEKYTSLVHAIRSAYPRASIVLLNGGMWAGIHSEELGSAWTKAVSGLESKDPGISHFVFAHWTSNHPRIADHRAMADEIDAWLGKQPFMRPGYSAPVPKTAARPFDAERRLGYW
jgi:lysophospholipase L1-like esterase